MAADTNVALPDDLPVDVAPADGRAARTARTRQSIVDALLSLLEEGDLQPTATRIAERAGISLRLIYHHFGDLESLFQATSQRQAERMAALAVPIDAALPLAERIDHFCTQRAFMLETITPVSRAARLHEPFSESLQTVRALFVRAGENAIDDLFAVEIEALDPDERPSALAALHLAGSWNSWDYLRTGGSSIEAATATMAHTFTVMLRA